MDSESQSHNVETKKKMVPKRKNKFAAKKQGEAETQVDDAQVHTEVQAMLVVLNLRLKLLLLKQFKNKIAASRLMGSL
ncbi:hypothetical protein Tco_0364301 [Tanacetum coccineum]